MHNVKDNSRENGIRSILAECNPFQLDLDGVWLERVFAAYRQPHRYFHTLDHLLTICQGIRNNEVWNNQLLTAELLLTALFHDAVWVPQGTDSEERSCEAFLYILNAIGNPVPADSVERIRQAILATTLQDNVNELATRFHDFDCQVIIHGSHVDLLDYEFQIFREYQYLNMTEYRRGRSAFFTRFAKRFPECRDTMRFLIDYLEHRRPRVGIYAGTFNPFHIGHLSILEKAERMFDKIIVAVGINPHKNIDRDVMLDKTLPFHEVVDFDTLMVDLIERESVYCDVTLVRGLRNGYDLDYEMNQLCFMQEMRPDTHAVYIPCDKRLEHVSSSALKGLASFNVSGRDSIYYPTKYNYYWQDVKTVFKL